MKISEEIIALSPSSKKYPKLLKHIPDPPSIIYVRGNADILSSTCFAVVGTRKLTDYGKRVTPSLTKDLANAGFTIVSGLAKGIDTLAHQAALDAGKPTIAVLGCGLDWNVLYPPQNKNLARKIIETGGAIVSEYPHNTHGTEFTFPQRNRIISGLSKGVLVIEADYKSGALITARHGTEQNRDVFVVPGSIFSEASRGTNFFIQKGAKLVTSAKDILTEYDISYNNEPREVKPDNKIESKILKIISQDPTHIDEIIRQSGYNISEIQATLMMMELNDKVINVGSNRYVISK